MSDPVRKTAIRKWAGIILLGVSLLLCLTPAVFREPAPEFSYAEKADPEWTVKEISAERNGPVKVNEADAEELTELKGIGETYSALIIAEREANGPFYYPEDLTAVRGIGVKTVEKIRNMIDMTTTESGNE